MNSYPNTVLFLRHVTQICTNFACHVFFFFSEIYVILEQYKMNFAINIRSGKVSICC